MAFISLAAGDVDAESPVSDDIMEQTKDNQDYLKGVLTDGLSSPQASIDTLKLFLRVATGYGLEVTNDVLVGGDIDLTGSITVGGAINTPGTVNDETDFRAIFAL